MSDATITALRAWSDAHIEAGSTLAMQLRELLAEYDATRQALATALAQVEDYVEMLRVKDAPILTVMDRVKAQAEILSSKAEVTA